MPDGGSVTGEITEARLELFRWSRYTSEEGTRSGHLLDREVPGYSLDYAIAEELNRVVAERDALAARVRELEVEKDDAEDVISFPTKIVRTVRARAEVLAEVRGIIAEQGSDESFEAWFDEYARIQGMSLDTRLIHFAEEIWKKTLREFLRRLEAPEPPEPEGGKP